MFPDQVAWLHGINDLDAALLSQEYIRSFASGSKTRSLLALVQETCRGISLDFYRDPSINLPNAKTSC